MTSQHKPWDKAAPNREPQGGKPAVCDGCQDVAQSMEALHAAILQLTEILTGLGRDLKSRYSTPVAKTNEVQDEESMARRLGLTRRVLARHRKDGKLPGCWVKNGRQIRWHVHDTMEAWKRGIA